MKSKNKVLAVILALAVIMPTLLPFVSHAVENESPAYEATNSYVLAFAKKPHSDYYFSYASVYQPLLSSPYGKDNPYTERTAINLLYNTANNDQFLHAYCVDEMTSIKYGTVYQRENLEDSKFFDKNAAEKLRSIMLEGFPNVGYSELGKAAGVDNLTLGEAVHATQLAIWQTSYGDYLTIEDFLNDVELYGNRSAWWTHKLYTSTMFDDECYAEINNGYADMENEASIEANTKKVFDYLMNLKPTPHNDRTVSTSSFESVMPPVATLNEDGTYNVSVTATIDVDLYSVDSLTLSAVLGDYVVSSPVSDGEHTKTVVFENIPANLANSPVKLALDGKQTASDVYMYEVEAGREAAQPFIAYSNLQLPVHAEVMAEPERVINFTKTTKNLIGDDKYEYIPLEGIKFDLYHVADWDDYLNNKVTLPPQEDIDLSELGDSTYHYPDYTAVTDADGKAVVSLTKEGLPDGVYVVAERAHPAITAPVNPFYILLPYTNSTGDGWEYELDIHPKNDVIGGIKIEKDVIEIGNDMASVDAYTDHTWIIGADIPVDIGEGKEYTISDTLDNRLDYIGNVNVRVEPAEVPVEGEEIPEYVVLTADTDYTLTVTDNDSLSEEKPSDSFVISLTKAGMAKVAAAVGENNADYKLRVYFDAQINANAKMGEEIPNQAHLEYTNSVNYTFNEDSDIPVVYTCGISIYKYDGKDETKALAGATFKVAKIVEEGTEGAVMLKIGDTEKPVIYIDFYTNKELTGLPATEVVTDDNGIGVIYGLAEGTYYLVETVAPAGYNLLSAPVEMTLNKASHYMEESDSTAEFTEGYRLKIANLSGYELPSTGGIGTFVYTAGGSLLCLVSGGTLLLRKKKDE